MDEGLLSQVSFREYSPADNLVCQNIFDSNCPPFFDISEKQLFIAFLSGLDIGEIKYKGVTRMHFNVVMFKDALIGCGGIYLNQDKNQVHMAWGMIHQSFHLKGIGRKFLEYRINLAQKLYPSQSIVLDTSQHTFSFFEKLGFTVLKITENGYAPGLHKYDMTYNSLRTT
jgi:[ribosomal protein S18]-alanine N-acetyltransferase